MMNQTTDSPEPLPDDDRTRRQEQRFKFQRVNEITGAFVLVVVAALIAAVIWTGHGQRWFRSSVELRIILPETGASGIRQGSEVYFLGTLVGTVSDVVVDEMGRMEAEANIRRDFFRFVRTDSSAIVKQKFGVVGDSIFEITRGEGAPLPEKDASIICNQQLAGLLESAVEEVRQEALLVLNKVNVGLDTWTTLGADLIATRERLDQLVLRGDTIVTEIQKGKGTIGQLLTDPAAADELKTLLLKANRSMDELQVTLNNFQKTSDNLRRASANLPAITDAIGMEAGDLPGIVLQTQQTLYEIERLIQGLERHWLIRKYIEQPQPATRIPPSEVAP